jgi:hypothetical protein
MSKRNKVVLFVVIFLVIVIILGVAVASKTGLFAGRADVIGTFKISITAMKMVEGQPKALDGTVNVYFTDGNRDPGGTVTGGFTDAKNCTMNGTNTKNADGGPIVGSIVNPNMSVLVEGVQIKTDRNAYYFRVANSQHKSCEFHVYNDEPDDIFDHVFRIDNPTPGQQYNVAFIFSGSGGGGGGGGGGGQTYSISGKVTGPDGAVSGIAVYLDKNTVEAGRATTDGNGNYTIPSVSPGSYNIRAYSECVLGSGRSDVPVVDRNITGKNIEVSQAKSIPEGSALLQGYVKDAQTHASLVDRAQFSIIKNNQPINIPADHIRIKPDEAYFSVCPVDPSGSGVWGADFKVWVTGYE